MLSRGGDQEAAGRFGAKPVCFARRLSSGSLSRAQASSGPWRRKRSQTRAQRESSRRPGQMRLFQALSLCRPNRADSVRSPRGPEDGQKEGGSWQGCGWIATRETRDRNFRSSLVPCAFALPLCAFWRGSVGDPWGQEGEEGGGCFLRGRARSKPGDVCLHKQAKGVNGEVYLHTEGWCS